MPRLLIGLALILGAYWLWRHLQLTWAHRKNPDAAATSIAMVRCAQCGLHVPQPQAWQKEQRWYCCQEHLQQAENRSD